MITSRDNEKLKLVRKLQDNGLRNGRGQKVGVPQPLIVYVRVSRKGDEEDARFHSPKEQEERARAFATDNGYAVGETVVDLDVSGGTHPKDRPVWPAPWKRSALAVLAASWRTHWTACRATR